MNEKQFSWNSDAEFKINGREIEIFLTMETILKSKQMSFKEFEFLQHANKAIGDVFERNNSLLTEVGQDNQPAQESGTIDELKVVE